MPVKTFEGRLSEQDKKEIASWNMRLSKEGFSLENARRRDRYHHLQSLDANISVDGRETSIYDMVDGKSLNGEETSIYNELVDAILTFIDSLDSKDDKIILLEKLLDDTPSSKIAKLTRFSDKTVTTHYQKLLQLLKEFLKDNL